MQLLALPTNLFTIHRTMQAWVLWIHFIIQHLLILSIHPYPYLFLLLLVCLCHRCSPLLIIGPVYNQRIGQPQAHFGPAYQLPIGGVGVQVNHEAFLQERYQHHQAEHLER